MENYLNKIFSLQFLGIIILNFVVYLMVSNSYLVYNNIFPDYFNENMNQSLACLIILFDPLRILLFFILSSLSSLIAGPKRAFKEKIILYVTSIGLISFLHILFCMYFVLFENVFLLKFIMQSLFIIYLAIQATVVLFLHLTIESKYMQDL